MEKQQYRKFYLDWWRVRRSTIYALAALCAFAAVAGVVAWFALRHDWLADSEAAATPSNAARIISFVRFLANIAAVLKEAFGFFWVGFYVEKGDQLVLGPFQGPLACTRIDLDKGVCGHAYSNAQTTLVDDVDKFPGHIACSSAARSEIVVPIFDRDERVYGVIDVDSDRLADFSRADADGLEAIAKIISEKII